MSTTTRARIPDASELTEEEASAAAQELKPLDLSAWKSPKGAATALAKYLRLLAVGIGQSPDEVALWSPEDAERIHGTAAWGVCWEGGPFEWAIALTGGESLWSAELGRYGSPPQVTGFYEQHNWLAEPYWSFDLLFYDERGSA